MYDNFNNNKGQNVFSKALHFQVCVPEKFAYFRVICDFFFRDSRDSLI